jgi:hypothetical protein
MRQIVPHLSVEEVAGIGNRDPGDRSAGKLQSNYASLKKLRINLRVLAPKDLGQQGLHSESADFSDPVITGLASVEMPIVPVDADA